ncbi:MAG: 4-(cytidine 5'-diphospho)-2-C-methyl-D-erythritol kinase [Elusimicrobiota bacterium]
MEFRAPAKINLFLNVGNRRDDGYHNIVSIMVKIGLYDRISIEPADEITVEGPDWLPQENNLMYRAAMLLKEMAPSGSGCRMKIEKNIPAGRGLGGGSSDCACVLEHLNRLWRLNMEVNKLGEIGGELGSDVNFFLHPGAGVVTGRGETVIPFENLFKGKKEIIIVDTGIEISTKEIYDNYPGGKLTEKDELNTIISCYKRGEWADILRNDLEVVVFKRYPVLRDLKNRLVNWGTFPLLSGSGACLFAIADDAETAESISQILSENFGYRSWLVSNTIETITGE